MSDPSGEREQSLMDRADRGWNFDPEFHAKVEMAVIAVVAEMGGHATIEQKGIARCAAGIALAITTDDLSVSY